MGETFSEGHLQNEWERPPTQQHVGSRQEQRTHLKCPTYTSSRLSDDCIGGRLWPRISRGILCRKFPSGDLAALGFELLQHRERESQQSRSFQCPSFCGDRRGQSSGFLASGRGEI